LGGFKFGTEVLKGGEEGRFCVIGMIVEICKESVNLYVEVN